MKQITVRIDGMQCGMCENHMNDAIRAAFPVKKVTSSHSKGETVIITDQDLTDEQLKAVVERTGYEFISVSSAPYEKKGFFAAFRKK